MPTETHIDVDSFRVWTPSSIDIDPNILRDYTIIQPSEMPSWETYATSTRYEIWGCGNARCPYKDKCQRYQEGYYNFNDENTCEHFEEIVD